MDENEKKKLLDDDELLEKIASLKGEKRVRAILLYKLYNELDQLNFSLDGGTGKTFAQRLDEAAKDISIAISEIEKD